MHEVIRLGKTELEIERKNAKFARDNLHKSGGDLKRARTIKYLACQCAFINIVGYLSETAVKMFVITYNFL